MCQTASALKRRKLLISFLRKHINIYFNTPLLAKHALVSIVSVSLLDFSEHFVEII